MTTPPEPPRRCVVVGTSGAGKTHLVRELAARLHCPHVELDELFWGPHWTPKPAAEFLRLATCAAAGERWVIDGNYSIARDAVWPAATHIVWLNFSRSTVLGRILRRTVRRVATRQALWHGNRESFGKAFLSRQSILVWSATTFAKNRRRYGQLMASGAFAQAKWVELRNPAQADAYLRHWQ
jgi:adenylate kinase family enzyme